MKIPITFLISVYNEEDRIKFTLDHATKWADEVLVIDKSSTDKTVEICKSYPNVRVETIPYSIKGEDDAITNINKAKYDWVFICVASEVPTKKCIEYSKKILEQTNGELDLIRVPRKYYSLGIYHEFSPWGINYFPFFINRKKAIIQNTIHENFLSHGAHCEAAVPFADDCCIYHFTHPTAKKYVEDMLQYFIVEANECKTKEQLQYKQISSINNIKNYLNKKWKPDDRRIFGHMCAWGIYNYGVGLFCWEKEHGQDVPKYYFNQMSHITNTEWNENYKL
jgi:glycosyltransferase involved in cell wall biosynthesis